MLRPYLFPWLGVSRVQVSIPPTSHPTLSPSVSVTVGVTAFLCNSGKKILVSGLEQLFSTIGHAERIMSKSWQPGLSVTSGERRGAGTASDLSIHRSSSQGSTSNCSLTLSLHLPGCELQQCRPTPPLCAACACSIYRRQVNKQRHCWKEQKPYPKVYMQVENLSERQNI